MRPLDKNRFRIVIFQFCFVFFVFIRIQNAEEAACSSADKSRKVLSLEFSVRSENMKLLVSKLRKDKIQIQEREQRSKDSVGLFVEMKGLDFEKIFSGRLDHKVVAYSSRSGSYCQSYLRSYRIPLRYKAFIREIKIPDPQLN